MPGSPSYAVIQYDGREFAGWQYQPSARTVQGDLEAVLLRLFGSRVVTRAAGRTDAGVHALGQVVSFSTPKQWSPDELIRALRALSPKDIWVKTVGTTPDGFDARRHAISRRYRYVVGCDDAALSPFRRHFEWALGKPLDKTLIRKACEPLIGTHDFRGYSAKGQDKPHYLCNIISAEWRERGAGEGFIFEIEADRFLHRMVRFLVGMMVDVARKRRPIEDVFRLLAEQDNEHASPPAPPGGLYLLGARYSQIDEVIDQ